jgi:hypothetical protein
VKAAFSKSFHDDSFHTFYDPQAISAEEFVKEDRFKETGIICSRNISVKRPGIKPD